MMPFANHNRLREDPEKWQIELCVVLVVRTHTHKELARTTGSIFVARSTSATHQETLDKMTARKDEIIHVKLVELHSQRSI